MTDYSKMTRPLSRKEASDYLLHRHGLRRSAAYLAKLAVTGGGPIFRKAGSRAAIYNIHDLDKWAASIISKPMHSTSDELNTVAA